MVPSSVSVMDEPTMPPTVSCNPILVDDDHSTSSEYASASGDSDYASANGDHNRRSLVLPGARMVVSLTVDEALSLIGTGPFQYYLLVACGLAFAGDAIEVSFLSFLSPCVQSEWGLSDFQTASVASVVFGGEMVSGCSTLAL